MDNDNYQLGIRAIHQRDIKSAIVEARQNQFGILEIHFSSPQFLPENYSRLRLNRIKAIADRDGIILQTHSEIGQSLIHANSYLRRAEKQKLKQTVQFSRLIGARCLTLHLGQAPQYYMGPDKQIRNDDVYAKYYTKLFEDSIKYIVSIAPEGMSICIENTDNFYVGYQKVLDTYLKTNKVFLTWDIMKGYSDRPTRRLLKDRWKFVNRNIMYVKNLHVSGPAHSGLKGYERDFATFFRLFQGKGVPMIIEVLSLQEAIKAKRTIRELGF